MPRKAAGLSRGAHGRAEAVTGNGLVARAVDRALDNPATSGGFLVMAVTAAAIITNAMFLQSGDHPEPLFRTRAPVPVEVSRAPPVVPSPRPRADHVKPAPPTPTAAPAPPPEPVAGRPSGHSDLIADTQRELARLGLYAGPIDGLVGARTRAAIVAYETAAGRPANGTASVELLDMLRRPPPAATQAAAPDAVVRADHTAATDETDLARRTEVYAGVQDALNRIGYGPIVSDGRFGAETADAIRRFELDNGLPITGEIGERVIARLVAIGAMPAL